MATAFNYQSHQYLEPLILFQSLREGDLLASSPASRLRSSGWTTPLTLGNIFNQPHGA